MIPISNPLLGFSVIILSGYIGGSIAKRVHLPKILGNLIVGLILGPFCLNIFSHQLISYELSPINSIAFGFIAISIALHIKLNELKETIILSFSDICMNFLMICTIIFLITKSISLSILLGITGATTAPAASLAIVKETRAKGPLVSALLPTIALNNLLCIVFFTIIIGLLETIHGSSFFILIKHLVMSSFLGIVIGLMFCSSMHILSKLRIKILWATFFTLITLIGICEEFKLSSLLSSICMGLVIINKKSVADEVFNAFNKFESFIYLLFFTMAGAHLNPTFIMKEWKLILIFVMSRFAGKVIGGSIGASIVKLNHKGLFGIGLISQAGLALAFLVLVQEKPYLDQIIEIYSTVVLSAVVLNEFVGGIATKLILKLSKEEGKAYPPVFGFIDNNSIFLELEAEDKWEAIAKLVHYLCIKKCIDLSLEGKFLEGIIERELSMTTGIGRSLAIPHGPLYNGENKIIGVFAICHKGIDFGSMDGKPVNFIILSLIPRNKIDAHLKYLIQVSRIFSKPFISSALMEARTEEEVLRILEEAQE